MLMSGLSLHTNTKSLVEKKTLENEQAFFRTEDRPEAEEEIWSHKHKDWGANSIMYMYYYHLTIALLILLLLLLLLLDLGVGKERF